MRLTSPLNLPAPGRRQCLYVVSTTSQTPVFLLNSRLGRFSAARSGSTRKGLHLARAPLLPKLRGHFAEFLDQESLERLRLLASPTCVGFRYGRPLTSPAKLFSAVCLRSLDGVRRPLRHRISASPGGFASPETPTSLHRIPPSDGPVTSASLRRLERLMGGTGILTRFPSATPFGLTLGAD